MRNRARAGRILKNGLGIAFSLAVTGGGFRWAAWVTHVFGRVHIGVMRTVASSGDMLLRGALIIAVLTASVSFLHYVAARASEDRWRRNRG